MSGWVVRTTHPKCQLAAFAVVCAFVCGSALAQPTPGSKNAGEENPSTRATRSRPTPRGAKRSNDCKSRAGTS